MNHLGELSYFLGVQIYRSNEMTIITQENYCYKLLKEFHLADAKIVTTPMETNHKFDDKAKEADATLYRSMVGSLIYLTITRPDIAYAVGILSRHMHNPTQSHMMIAKRVFRYLKGTTNYGIQYPSQDNTQLATYTATNNCPFKY